MITREEILDLLQNDAPGAVNGPVDVSKRLYAISKMDEELDELRQLRKEHDEYFAERIAKKLDAQDFLRNQIKSFMINTETSKLPLAQGTVSLVQRQKVIWPGDNVLLDFAKRVGIPVTTVEKVGKPDIAEYIKRTGDTPPGYTTQPEESISVRQNKKSNEPSFSIDSL